jgi:hypothetical protein
LAFGFGCRCGLASTGELVCSGNIDTSTLPIKRYTQVSCGVCVSALSFRSLSLLFFFDPSSFGLFSSPFLLCFSSSSPQGSYVCGLDTTFGAVCSGTPTVTFPDSVPVSVHPGYRMCNVFFLSLAFSLHPFSLLGFLFLLSQSSLVIVTLLVM